MTDDLRIALWGPTGSGKTWLFNALAKELQWYNNEDTEFEYNLTTRNGAAIVPTVPNQGPTQAPHDIPYQFTKQGKKHSISHKVSSHKHEINIHENPGIKLVNALNPGSQFSRPTYITLANSIGVIAILEAGYQNSSSTGGVVDESDYARLIQSLCELLAESRIPDSKKRYLAVCVTKMDKLLVTRKANEIIDAYFPQIKLILSNYVNHHYLEIECFCTSAVGYYRNGSENVPNFESMTQDVLHKHLWHPFNVAAPFFWIFEKIERARLEKINNGKPLLDYLGYPNVLQYPVTPGYF